MAEAAVTFLLESLNELMVSKMNLIAGAESELRQLQNELFRLQGFLKEAVQKQTSQEQFGELERQIMAVIYDAEDVIDTCLMETAVAEPAKRRKPEQAHKRSDLAEKIQSLMKEKVKPMLAQAAVDFAQMKIRDAPPDDVDESSPAGGKGPTIVRRYDVVGYEDEEQIIMDFLLEEKEELDVNAITGMPGLGKTTLAWKVFQDKTVIYNFPTRIWVTVSQDFSLRRVLLKILKSFTNQDMSGNNDHDLVQMVRAFLQEARFLLVMDDVWSAKAWNDIQQVLPKGNSKGKVLVTSRIMEVGYLACRGGRGVQAMRFLSQEESWKLLQYDAFGNLDSCPRELAAIGMHIVQQCGGVALAILLMRGILMDLYSKNSLGNAWVKNAWVKVSQNVEMHFVNNVGELVSNMVELSYISLPHELRDSFLYLGMFPEDYEIPASTLAHLWIAEGFVQHKTGELPEETALNNLNILISRNLVMVDKRNLAGQIKTCRIHDVIRNFCNSRGGIDEQNVFKEIEMSDQGVSDPQVSEIPKYRRLSIHFKLAEFLAQKRLKGPRVRSFLCFYKQPSTLNAKYISIIPDAFPLLRVLDSNSFKFIHFPPQLTKLIHLRYLTLSFNDLNRLPDSISDLWNLQTLLVDTAARTLEIKANIWKMNQLRHLKTKAAIRLTGKGEADEACLNLQTLTAVSPECCTKEVLKRAHNIKRLGIRGKLATLLDGNYSLHVLDHLENLKMANDTYYGSTSENRLHGLPPLTFFPLTLKKLTLSATNLNWTHISTLGKINSLQVLKLKDNAFTGQTWVADGHGFPSLRALLIESSDFFFWTSSFADFPLLECLILNNCENLREIPMGLAKSLQTLSVERVGTSVVENAKKIKLEKEVMQGELQSRFSRLDLKIGLGCE